MTFNRNELNRRLREIGISQIRFCRALGINKTAPTHWVERAPSYALAFLVALEMRLPAEREDLIIECVGAQNENLPTQTVS